MRLDVISVVKIFNHLKVKKRVRDYAIFGAVASTFYIEPIFTDDIDIIVFAETHLEYISIGRELAKLATRKLDFGFIIADTKVQIQPTSIHPLNGSALINARPIRIGNIRTKIVDREHLILLHLRAFGDKDVYKARLLLRKADWKYLDSLIERFDKNGSLRQKLQKIL